MHTITVLITTTVIKTITTTVIKTITTTVIKTITTTVITITVLSKCNKNLTPRRDLKQCVSRCTVVPVESLMNQSPVTKTKLFLNSRSWLASSFT
jgi:hypothetical protein